MAEEESAQDSISFDVLIVGAGPAGLASAIQLAQLAKEHQRPFSIAVIEKSAEIGGHILSGALFDPHALNELLPNWQDTDCPVRTKVKYDDFYWLTNSQSIFSIPPLLRPKVFENHDHYIISLSELCRWLAKQAELLGVEIYPGFCADKIQFEHQRSDSVTSDNADLPIYMSTVKGITTKAMGLDKQGNKKENYQPSMLINARYTIFAEGSRGHLGKALIKQLKLDKHKQPQHFALGIKEIWQVPKQQHQQGRVVHSLGWPLSESSSTGGAFMYHLDDSHIAVGLITDLNYRNPYLSPFDEFQRLKHHPLFAQVLQNGKRIEYGARAITKGGLASLPKQSFQGGVLIGCDAGTLNMNKLKGCHTAMKSGMLAASAVYSELIRDHTHTEPCYNALFESSWLYDELHQARNTTANIHKFGQLTGAIATYLEQSLFSGRAKWQLNNNVPDHACLLPISKANKINYPKPDNQLSFDKTSSLYLASISHPDDQPCHLHLQDLQIPISQHLKAFDEPSQRYCPAGVYEVITENNQAKFQINAGNCLQCKACDIKDPSQNISWTPPESGSGPNYRKM
ncbi:electron transfer flavoprotein-ubiquinone oxidoreductase [Photobacterium angustum]|uniref:Electron transfer flavoprotein-ubiquinone oxidoreductase n=1 Tax=Photobacterium angustum TaxID=661 RepID=A0A2S7VK12_PHOAN|nr:electron transfer flavoprotein-ubiquinone oxidoreductase [Photobacterium angustum]PQJ62496.1 electron transfer flavoprotein-ubiquinone oxidoreductase [Photobacterium angustum]